MAPERIAANHSERTFDRKVRRVLLLQTFFACVTSALIGLYLIVAKPGDFVDVKELFDMLKASGYGSLLGMGNTLLSARSVRRSGRAVIESPRLAMMPVYIGLLNKLILVGGGIALGLVVLGLKPPFVVAGYVVVQIAFFWANARTPTANDTTGEF